MEYHVRLKIVGYVDVIVDAEDAEDAQETAEGLYLEEVADDMTDFEPYEVMECVEIS